MPTYQAYLYVERPGVWHVRLPPLCEEEDGHGVDLSVDGSDAVVGVVPGGLAGVGDEERLGSKPAWELNQRYLWVNVDQHPMNKITLTSNKKAKNRRKERPL